MSKRIISVASESVAEKLIEQSMINVTKVLKIQLENGSDSKNKNRITYNFKSIILSLKRVGERKFKQNTSRRPC